MARATRADLAALWELEQSAFLCDRISPQSWSRLIASRSAHVTVARASGEEGGEERLLGATVLLQRARSSVTRLYSLAVAPSARGRGLAIRLVASAIQQTRGIGAAVLRLETRVDNHAAQRLFVRHGFTPLGRRPAYYEDGADALLYEKSLEF